METKYCRLPKIFKIHYLVMSLNKTNIKSYCTKQRNSYSVVWVGFLKLQLLAQSKDKNC